jgi:protein-S-isoprenylcysteine O-methyltransferase Ste14
MFAVQAVIRARIPPPVYALCAAALIWLVNQNAPILRWIPPPWNKAGWVLMALGLGLDLYSILLFVRSRTTVNPMQPDRATRLVVSGVYRLSRNPMYLGLVLVLSGWAWLLGSPISFLAVWLFARILVIVQIGPEEIALRDRFGESYVAYCQSVNRWIGQNRRPPQTNADRN